MAIKRLDRDGSHRKQFERNKKRIYATQTVCGICGKGKDTYLCKKCENKLKTIAIWGKDKYLDKYFENHYYIFKYDNLIRNLILDYKFNEKPYLFRSFSEFINKYQKSYLQLEIYDIIIPVPLSKKRKK